MQKPQGMIWRRLSCVSYGREDAAASWIYTILCLLLLVAMASCRETRRKPPTKTLDPSAPAAGADTRGPKAEASHPPPGSELPRELPPGFGRRARELHEAALHPPPPKLPQIFPITPTDSIIWDQLPSGVTRRRSTGFDRDAIRDSLLAAEAVGKAWLILFPDKKFLIDVTALRDEKDQLILEATIESRMMGWMRLAILPQGGVGFIHVDGEFFEFFSYSEGKLTIDEIDQGVFARSCNPRALPTQPASNPNPPQPSPPPPAPPPSPPPPPGTLAMGAPTEITVLVLLANQPERLLLIFDAAFGYPLLKARYKMQLDGIFSNSSTTVTAKVLVENTSYVPSGDPSFDPDLTWVTTDAGVLARRNATSADAVFLALWHPKPYSGGLSHQNDCLCEKFAFGVVEFYGSIFISNLAHELGHLMGMQHDRILEPPPETVVCPPTDCPTPHKSSHVDQACNSGWVIWDGTDLWRTIMAAPKLCRYIAPSNCHLLESYSFPSAFGTSCPPAGEAIWAADNRGQLLFAAPVVAAFR